MEWNERGRPKLEGRKSWQITKHSRLYLTILTTHGPKETITDNSRIFSIGTMLLVSAVPYRIDRRKERELPGQVLCAAGCYKPKP